MLFVIEWGGVAGHDRVHRQLSVSSDSKLLDEDIREEARVIMRPRKPPRPKSEVLLHQPSGTTGEHRRTKRFSAFGVCYYATHTYIQYNFPTIYSIILILTWIQMTYSIQMNRFRVIQRGLTYK